jgi:putative ABC transport system ATP-binding protein
VAAVGEITLRNVHKAYVTDSQRTEVLRGLEMSIETGESALVFGPSGSGKSTLLNVIGGLDAPDEGTVLVSGIDVTGLDDGGLTTYRREHIGFIFQFFNLIPSLTALENVELGIEPVVDRPRERATEYLERVGLAAKLDRYPAQLSGGEQQRVGIARALAKQPAVVLADEPTGNLDRESAEQVMATMREMQVDEGTTFVLVSHDPVVEQAADRKLWLERGQLREDPP